jgi:ABC-type Fe3+/spermidine/putrescine transport system ATPase subunit
MRAELRLLKQQLGVTVVYVTHDQAEAMTLADRVAVMDRGSIAQLGTPRQIYDEPVNRFVADFVGRANFVRGVIRERSDDAVVVDVLGATRRASRAPGSPAEGAEVDVMIRPEEVHVVGAGSEGAVPAVVRHASFVGASAVYQLQCAGVELIAIAPLERGVPLAADGDAVGLRIRDGALRAVPSSR